MKPLSSFFTFLFIVPFIVTGFTTETEAFQDTRTEATMAYNDARELAEGGQFIDAIELYREARELAQSPDCEECGDIVELVENQLPRVYFSRATNAFQTFRDEGSTAAADRAIEFFQDAAEAGEEFGDDQVRDRSRAVIPQVYYNKSLVQYRQDDHSSAIESLDRAIELNENYTLAYYQRAIVLNNMENPELEEVLEWFDRAIEVGQRVGDSENVARAQRRAGAELVYQSVQRLDEERHTEALQMLQRAEAYTPDNVDMHYRFAEVYNNRGQYNQAVQHANRALELETGGVTDRAKIYFELGVAYQGLEQVDNACNAYENAAYGDFRDPALYEMEHELECEGYANAGR